MKRLRVYADTSVLGGCFDEEFAEFSVALLDMVRRGDMILLISDLLADELLDAPQQVKDVFASLGETGMERIHSGPESEHLRDQFLAAGVLGAASEGDAHHVALATVARADMIVSWNFRHIVHYEKMRGFNAVNLREGYQPIEIHSPREVV